MRVLHVLNTSAPEIDGYSVRSTAILRAQRDDGIAPMVVTSPRHASTTGGVETVDGIRHYRTRGAPFPPVPLARELWEVAKLGARAEAVARAEGVDVVHAHSPSLWGRAALRAARRLGLPFVYEVRALWEDAAVADDRSTFGSPRYRLSRALETSVLRAADAIVVICEGLRRDVCGRGLAAEDVRVVPNGVDVDAFRPRSRDAALAAQLGIEPESTVIGYIGSLRRWEGIGDLVRVAPALVRRFPGMRVLIVGDGDQRPALAAAIREAGVAAQVQLRCGVPPPEVGRYYSLLDVVVYPRRRSRLTELTTPLKPLEAMAMAKAVVIADVGGLRELADGAALSYPSGSAAELERVCAELISRPELRASLGEEARRLARQRAWTSAARIYRDVYAAARSRNERR